MRKWLLLVPIILIVIGIDQITKSWVVQNLAIGESVQPIPELAPYFQITRSFNTGAAFGLLADAGNLFLVVAVGIIGFMLYQYPRVEPNTILTKIATGLVIGGAVGNVLDRIQYNLVVDFIHYQIPNVISNVSNIADHAVVIGVFLLILDTWLRERNEQQSQIQKNPSPEMGEG